MVNVLEFSGRLNPVPTAHLHKFLNILRDSTPTMKYQATSLFGLSREAIPKNATTMWGDIF